MVLRAGIHWLVWRFLMNLSANPIRSLLLAAAMAAPLAAPSAALAQPGVDGVVREGEGNRRNELNKMERQPFDFALLGSLKDWKNGEALSAGTASGKPVVIMFWTDFLPAGKRAMALAQRLATQNAANGLIVVAVHGPKEWEAAAKPAAPAGATLLLAHDVDGKLRQALNSDNDPDFYIIDRAGQLRFADVETQGVEAAIGIVVKETRDEAAGVNSRLATEAARRDADIRRTEAMRTAVDMTQLPELPFTPPSADDYKNAKWPDPPKDPNAQNQDPNAPPELPPALKLPDNPWMPEAPKLDGRVRLVYIFHPEARVTFDYGQWSRFNLLQRQLVRDVRIVGLISPVNAPSSDGSQTKKLEVDPAKLTPVLEQWKTKVSLEHYISMDPSGGIFEQLQKNYPDAAQGVPVPWVGIVSSDGTLRWWGWMNSSRFQGSFDRIIAADPGVKARRAAEEAYLREKNGQ